MGGFSFALIVVYGSNDIVEHQELWDELWSLRSQIRNKDWLVIGDFNEIWIPTNWEGHDPFDQIGANEFNTVVWGLK